MSSQQSDLDFLNSLGSSVNPAPPAPNADAPAVASDPPKHTLKADDPLAPIFNALSSLASSSLSPSDEPAGDSEAPELSEDAVRDLLAQMDQADHAAEGLEDRLDELLGRLDGMLGSLGALAAVGEGEGGDVEEDGEEEAEELKLESTSASASEEK